ncbi:MAG: hypothetical protein E7211_03360 [Clostridium lundense]|nr:hypothetical protein [Clostridium lundense]
MKKELSIYNLIKVSINKYIILILFLIAMIMIHQYIFLYADDFYYFRDASKDFTFLPHFIIKQLNLNGRVWVHVLLLFIVKYDVYLFRVVNPIIIMLTVLLISKISMNLNISNKNFIVSTLSSSLFFLLLPIEITNTTIYYAACSLNYLYPTAVAIYYAYLLYRDYKLNSENYKTKWWIILLAFFAGASTQQAGMISIGFTVLITLYFQVFEKKKLKKIFFLYYIANFIGYAFVTYGSIKRMVFEKNSGHETNIKAAITELLKTNIFSIPVAGYVLIICLCSMFWLCYYTYNEKNNKPIIFVNKILVLTVLVEAIGYVYTVLYKKYNLRIFTINSEIDKLQLFFITFTLVYVISIIYVSVLILFRERYPFILFCSINAIGAQAMLIVADARFAGTYKIMFPSLLLMSVFIVYSFLKFYESKIFFNNFKFIKISMIILFIGLAVKVFSTTYIGYKNAAYPQSFNLNAIKNYHKNTDKSVLKLKKVPKTKYGYNVGNWNKMPYFMKQCYKINENTIIKYY